MFRKPKTAASADRVVVPSLDSVDPTYSGLVAKRRELEGLDAKLDAERSEILTKISSGASVSASDARVAELLDEPTEDLRTTSLRERLAEISQEAGSITRAISVINGRITDARRVAYRTICDAVRPAMTERVQTFVASLAAAVEAGREIEHILDNLEMGGVAWVGPIPPLRTRWLTDTRAPIFAKEAFEAGMISEVPEALR